MSADRPLDGRLAVVTGGTRGIGAATSEALAGLGATVVATYRSKAESANAFAEDVSARAPGQVHVAAYDLAAGPADPQSAEQLLQLASEHGDIDILVASASGPYRQAPLAEQSAEELAEKLSTDIAALHRLVIPVTGGMRERGFGRVVVVGSLHALGPTAPGMAASGIAKAAEAAYVTFAVDELTGPGVTINLIEPGFIENRRQRGSATAGQERARRPDPLSADRTTRRCGGRDQLARHRGILVPQRRPDPDCRWTEPTTGDQPCSRSQQPTRWLRWKTGGSTGMRLTSRSARSAAIRRRPTPSRSTGCWALSC